LIFSARLKAHQKLGKNVHRYLLAVKASPRTRVALNIRIKTLYGWGSGGESWKLEVNPITALGSVGFGFQL